MLKIETSGGVAAKWSTMIIRDHDQALKRQMKMNLKKNLVEDNSRRYIEDIIVHKHIHVVHESLKSL